MAEYERSKDKWRAYYEMVSDRPVRSSLSQVLRRFDQPGRAVDLGCGAGNETRYMLQHGWQVLAIDQQPSALDFVRNGLPGEQLARLELRAAAFENLAIPPAELIWAGLSLPFCPPEYFDRLWAGIVAALSPGGRFAGDFFGERHAWYGTGTMIFHTRDQVLGLFDSFKVEYLREEEGEQVTAMDGVQHWHMFSLQARKR